MQVLIVVGHGQHIAFFPEITPVERQVGIRKPVGKVRHPFSVGQVLSAAGNGRLHSVADVHLSKVAACAYPVCEVVADGQAEAFCLDFTVVDIGCCLLAAAQIRDVALYVIFRIAVDHSAFHIQGMFPECLVVAQVEVQIVAILRPDAQFTHFQVFVAKHFFDGRQAISLFVRQLCLQVCQDEVGSGCPVSERVG